MKYIIMCGGKYKDWKTPKHLLPINGEPIVSRTIRLLRENGINDICISTDNMEFKKCGVPILKHKNHYNVRAYNDFSGYWCDAFYPLSEPACYIFGDVIFSPEAIKTIVNIPTNDIEFFASAPPFSKYFIKEWAEPYAFKVVNQKHLSDAIRITKELDAKKKFDRKPLAWELWQVIKETPLNEIDYTNYTVINDYTCDIDNPEDVAKIRAIIGEIENG